MYIYIYNLYIYIYTYIYIYIYIHFGLKGVYFHKNMQADLVIWYNNEQFLIMKDFECQ